MIHLMSLNFEYLDEPLRIENFTSFVIEDRRIFTKVVESLYQYDEEQTYLKIFDEHYESLKPSELMMMTDILGFDMNSTSVLKLIYRDLELQISEKPEIKTEIERLLQDVTRLVNAELLDFDLDLESDEITFLEVLKSLGVQVEVESDTIFERLFEIIQVFKYLSKKKLLVLINTGVYFSSEEITAIVEYTKLQNVSLLLLDPCKISGVLDWYCLDNDYCLIHEKMV